MDLGKQKTILFLCTGNYYRSRFAEIFFNSIAKKMGLPWRSTSRGLALELGQNNIGPMSKPATAALKKQGIETQDYHRAPVQVGAEDFEKAQRVIALKEAEHLPMVRERFPAWVEKVEFWHIHDVDAGTVPEALDAIERAVMDLVAQLLGGGGNNSPPARIHCPRCKQDKSECACPKAREVPKAEPVVKVGRETKGRRGKGVTLISDLPLDENGLRELAAKLKNRCGTGGTVKDGRIEIQGDQRDRLIAELRGMGFKVKQSGG